MVVAENLYKKTLKRLIAIEDDEVAKNLISDAKHKYDETKKEATYVRYPERNELNADINEALVVEFYNR